MAIQEHKGHFDLDRRRWGGDHLDDYLDFVVARSRKVKRWLGRVFSVRGLTILAFVFAFYAGLSAAVSRVLPGWVWGLDVRSVRVLGTINGTWPQVIIDRTIGDGWGTMVRIPDTPANREIVNDDGHKAIIRNDWTLIGFKFLLVDDTPENRARPGADVVRGVSASRRVGLRSLDQGVDRECWQETGLRFYMEGEPFPATPLFLNQLQGSPPNPFCTLENGTYSTDWEWTREPIWWAPWMKFQIRTTSAPFRIDGVAGIRISQASAPVIVPGAPLPAAGSPTPPPALEP